MNQHDRATVDTLLTQLLHTQRNILYDVLKSLDSQITDFKITWEDEK